MNKLLRQFTQKFIKSGRPLKLEAFRAVFVARLQEHWPDVDQKMAFALFDDTLPDEFGHPGYDWTKEGARELADICVSDQQD